jgi:hypothetical protein
MSCAAILNCKDQKASFNRHSAELKAEAVADGMVICSEWDDGGFQCWRAEQKQETLRQGLGVFSHAGACVNVMPRVWYNAPMSPHTYETIFRQKGGAA